MAPNTLATALCSAGSRRSGPRYPRPALLGVALVIPLALGCATDMAPGGTGSSTNTDSPAMESTPPATPPGEPSDSAPAEIEPATATTATNPVGLHVPSIGLREELIDLAIQDDGTLEPPADWDDVGWFAEGPRPGAPGPTVFAGHVDSTTGPAVFYRVLELSPGDDVEVTSADGSVQTYRVERVEDHPKDDFPTRDVFSGTLDDELRLITCTGEFDTTDQRHLDNRVVFATATD